MFSISKVTIPVLALLTGLASAGAAKPMERPGKEGLASAPIAASSNAMRSVMEPAAPILAGRLLAQGPAEVPIERSAPRGGNSDKKEGQAEVDTLPPDEFSPSNETVSIKVGAGLLSSPEFSQVLPEFSAKDAEFQNVIRLLALKTGMNILLDPTEIEGNKKITFQLHNVTLGQALRTILKTNQIGYTVEEGNIIRLFPQKRARILATETTTEVIELNWRQATDLEKAFVSFMSKNKNPDGTAVGAIKANEETQSLIVTDVPENVQRIKEMIQQIDRPDRQVTIEARLVDVQLGALRAFKTDWSASKVNKDRAVTRTRNSSIGSSTGRTESSTFVTDPITKLPVSTLPSGGTTSSSTSSITDTISQALGPSDAIGGMLNVLSEGFGVHNGQGTLQFGSTIGILGSNYTLDAALFALESRDIVEVLSTPRVTTLNNVLANISIIQKIPYVQGEIQGQNVVQTIKFEEAGQTIGVKPIISRDGFVRLDIELTQQIFRNRVGAGDLDPPLIDERTAKSTVIVKDHNTVVLGGLRGLRRSSTTDAVPWMHRIPLIGWAFKDKSSDQTKTELVLMVTPAIVQEALITDTEKELYDRIDVNWHLPDYFFDDVSSFDDSFDFHD